MAHELLTDGRLRDRGVFDQHAVGRLWRERQTGARDHRYRLWSLVMLELWFRQFVDGAGIYGVEKERSEVAVQGEPVS
jgi:asparagine synthase (glutamine-hydrolysing)